MIHSFDIKNSKDLYQEFSRRVEEYKHNMMSSGNAVICAILCWHVIEWIEKEYKDIVPGFPNNFRNHVKNQCHSFSYMQDITNGSKHKGITRYTPNVKNTEKHNGAFSSGFSKGFDVSCLKMELENGEVVYFDEEIAKAKEYIHNYFVITLNEKV